MVSIKRGFKQNLTTIGLSLHLYLTIYMHLISRLNEKFFLS